MDKAGRKYWDTVWEESKPNKFYMPMLFDLESTAINDYYYVQFHKLFSKLLKRNKGMKLKILEIGCANSMWLIYFNKVWNFDVYGLDYSENGCELERKLLKHNKIEGERVYCCDFNSPSEDLLGKFDLVLSFGVMEHFEDTTQVLKVFSKYIKPGGYLFTEIPNLKGIPGFITRQFNREVYDIHTPLNKEELAYFHKKASYKVVSSSYVSFFNYSMINIENRKGSLIYKLFYHLGWFLTKASIASEKYKLNIKPNGLTSPYIYCYCKFK